MALLLVVEDEKGVRHALGMALEEAGHQVRSAASAQEALDAIEKNPFDIVVTDLCLPDLSGADLLRSVLQSRPLAKVILMTENTDPESAKAAVRLGAFDCLEKPVGRELLCKTVQAAALVKKLEEENRNLSEQVRRYREYLAQIIAGRPEKMDASLFRSEDETGRQPSEERFQELVLNSHDLIILTDPDGLPGYISPQSEKIFGYPPGKFLGRGLLEILHPDDLDRVDAVLERALAQQEIREFEYRGIHKNGEIIWVSHTIRPVLSRGKLTAFQHNLRDITARKQAEEALAESQVKLEEQNEIFEQKALALREQMNQTQSEKKQLEDQVRINIEDLILPLLAKMREKGSHFDRAILDMLEQNFKNLASKFGKQIKGKSFSLTQRETEICNMIRGGLSSKEIADLLNISYRSVTTHRFKIRKKLGISNQEVNLETFLNNL